MTNNTQVWSRLSSFWLGSLHSMTPPKMVSLQSFFPDLTPEYSLLPACFLPLRYMQIWFIVVPFLPSLLYKDAAGLPIIPFPVSCSWNSLILALLQVSGKNLKGTCQIILPFLLTEKNVFTSFPSFSMVLVFPITNNDACSGPSPVGFGSFVWIFPWSSCHLHFFWKKAESLLIPGLFQTMHVGGDGCFWGQAYMR